MRGRGLIDGYVGLRMHERGLIDGYVGLIDGYLGIRMRGRGLIGGCLGVREGDRGSTEGVAGSGEGDGGVREGGSGRREGGAGCREGGAGCREGGSGCLSANIGSDFVCLGHPGLKPGAAISRIARSKSGLRPDSVVAALVRFDGEASRTCPRSLRAPPQPNRLTETPAVGDAPASENVAIVPVRKRDSPARAAGRTLSGLSARSLPRA